MVGRPPEDDDEELRIGLVLNGGVSLAVWMGGVVTEVDRLRRGDGPYGELLDLLATRARVDVIAGASAGGLNGGLLATAIAHGQPLDGLRELWVSAGGFLELFRSPFEPHPPSLMDGDGYFRAEIHNGLRTVAGAPRGAPAGVEPVHLTMVTSLLTGITSGLADDFGAVIPDATHLGSFTFQRDGQPTGRDDWAAPQALERIALAARSSASFPFAFEPSFVPVKQDVPGRPDMAGPANFPSSRFAVDGGALMNKPFAPALAAIYAQPASRQVRRVLLYVAPDPGAVATDVADDIAAPPSLVTTLLASAMTMPRTESVGAELKEIRAHNDAVINLRQVRASLSRADPTPLAAAVFDDLYRAQRSRASVDAILARMDAAALAARPARAGGPVRTVPVRDRNALRDALVVARDRCLPAAFPASAAEVAADPAAWPWGINPVEAAANTVLDLLNQGLGLARPGADEANRAVLRAAREEVHRHRQVVAAIRELDDGFWEEQWRDAATPGWAARAFQDWENVVDSLARLDPRIADGVFEALTGRAVDVAGVLVAARPTLLAVAATAGADGAQLRASVAALAPRARRGQDGRAECLRRLLGLDVVLTSFSTAAPRCDQALRLMLLSGNTPNAFDRRETVEAKLNGVNVGHFAAFYKASWRANDWMFGRLDGAWRLAQAVLAPERLRQLYQGDAAGAFAVIEAVSRGTTPGREAPLDVREYLATGDVRQWDPDLARAELAFLDDGSPPPPALVECARGVARRIQVSLLAEELPNVEEAVRTDVAEGAFDSSGGEFARAYPAHLRGQALPAATAVTLFKKCRIGTEKMGDELGSNLMTATASAAAAVSVKAATGAGAGLGPLRPALGLLRTAVMSFYVLARAAVTRNSIGLAVVMILLTASGLVLALPYVSADVDPPGPLTVAAAAVVVGSGLLAATRARAPAGWVLMGLLTLAGFAAPLLLIRKDGEQADLEGLASVAWALRPILAVAALIVVPWACGRVAAWFAARRRRRGSDPEVPPAVA